MFIKRICIVLVVLLLGCEEEVDDWKKTSVAPVVPGSVVQIRVVQANNDRLPRMSPGQVQIMLASAQLTVWKNFGVYVEFTEAPEIGIDRLFALIPPPVKEVRKDSIYDFKSGNGDKRKLAEGIRATLAEHGTKFESALAFAKPYLPEGNPPTDLASFSDLLANTMLERLEAWRHINAADGAPVLDASPYNEWVYWDTLGYGNLPYDVVITNQFIASAEYYGVDIHSAIRGGVTVGTTSYNRTGKYGSYVFWSTFPFTDNSELSRRMRGDDDYSETDAAELSGAYLAHEIGHLLLQLGHPFGQKACVMNPASMLRFRQWFYQVYGAGCLIGSRPEMNLGAIPPTYNATWVRMAQQP
ncbi:MAG: hypothetical protein Q7U91_13645 [Sideroxyarcus sp.]|nr:hypothetical protein [Sideroxyarcus sp.]